MSHGPDEPLLPPTPKKNADISDELLGEWFYYSEFDDDLLGRDPKCPDNPMKKSREI